MTTAVTVAGPVRRSRSAARRAVLRWSWRLFEREWRQQLLVLTLVVVAVGATVFGLGFATNAQPKPTTTVSLPGGDPQLDADIAAITAVFGTGEVIHHQRVSLPGTLSTLDVRAQDVSGRHPTLRLVAGRFPATTDEVALTGHAAGLLGLHVGDTWTNGALGRRVVGLVENPEGLDDQFALVVQGGADPPTTVTVLVHGTPERVGPIRIPSGLPLRIEGISASDKALVAVTVLALAAVGLLFVALVAVAGFAVVAQRHLRALGMLGSLGATDSHTRLVLIGDGAAVGATGAAVGVAAGLGAWLAFAPHLETLAGHRIDRFDLPWWAIVVAAVLAVVAAAGAAWWPGRALARVSVIEALSGRPPRPRPARSFAAAGLVLAGVGALLLVLANRGAEHKSPPLVIAGVLTATVGVLLLAPLAITLAAKASRGLPVGPRLALRDLGRYQARAGAALGAVTLALGVASTVSIAAAYQTTADGPQAQNLPANEMVVYLSQDVRGPVPETTGDGLRTAQQAVDGIAASLNTHDVLPLQRAVDLSNQNGPALRGSGQLGREPAALLAVTRDEHGVGIKVVQDLYAATPEVLARLHVASDQLDPTADIAMSRTALDAVRRNAGSAELMLGANPRVTIPPRIQTLDLPAYTSEPVALVTPHGLTALGLTSAPAGWLVTANQSLADSQIAAASKTAAAAGLALETRANNRDFGRVGRDATIIGILFALGVLAVTVGLIRAESAHELRTLSATGAPGRTRRALTCITAATLGLLGAILGAATAYLTLAAWYHAKLSPLGHPPVANLFTLIVLLPAIAGAGGFVLAGREPPAIARRPLD